MPFGNPLAVSDTVPVNPLLAVIVTVTGAVVPPTWVDTFEGATLIVKSAAAAGGAEDEPPQETRENEARAVNSSIVRFTLSSRAAICVRAFR